MSMTDDEAAWVREHVWPKVMRQAYRDIPAYFHHCACQWGPCGACERGRHDRCIHGPNGYQPFPSDECSITNRKWQVLALPEPFKHPARSATGWHQQSAANVWLADRRCVWSCPCECRAEAADEPQPILLVPSRPLRRLDPAGQEALFEVWS